jgi:competence protein ComEC
MALVPASTTDSPESGSFQGEVTLLTDVFEGRFGYWAIASLGSWRVRADMEASLAGRGDVLVVEGDIEPEPGRAGGRDYQAILEIRSVKAVRASTFLPHRAGVSIRLRVTERLQPLDEGRALLAGFLIGDTSGIANADIEAMRRSGLAHFVAVSGSNVALFLALLAVVAGPLAVAPRRRALVGLLGLPVYAAATRFEPSVLRASVMAGIALGGRLVGIVLEAWQLLALSVSLLVVIDPSLTRNVGFQLSAAATAGVLIGARWPGRGVIRRALTITVGAQLAVAPLLLLHFGSIPLLSPLVNLLAAPLVSGATLAGALGVAGIGFLLEPAVLGADLVLTLARGAAGWPQLGPSQAVLLAVVTVLAIAYRRLRVIGVAVAGLALITAVLPEPLPPGTVVVLDVGQGDAILVHGGEGRYALVDGGPDGAILFERLREFGVRELELVVMSHPHADHSTGLAELVGRMRIGEAWARREPHETGTSRRLLDALEARQVTISSPQPGQRFNLGVLDIIVHGPTRHYASPNDESIVVEVAAARTMLLAGDIETYAQSDLRHLRADVLKVPHQGAATSDPDWLKGVGADVAVISVGPNKFGHPAEWVVELLEESGAEVRRTDVDGDVVIELS